MVWIVFEGEKTDLFWLGLIILGLASVVLFGILWMIAVWNGYTNRFTMLKQSVPLIAGAIAFILIGFNMMKSSVKKS